MKNMLLKVSWGPVKEGIHKTSIASRKRQEYAATGAPNLGDRSIFKSMLQGDKSVCCFANTRCIGYGVGSCCAGRRGLVLLFHVSLFSGLASWLSCAASAGLWAAIPAAEQAECAARAASEQSGRLWWATRIPRVVDMRGQARGASRANSMLRYCADMPTHPPMFAPLLCSHSQDGGAWHPAAGGAPVLGHWQG